MRTIADYLTNITNYRDELINFMASRWHNLINDLGSSNKAAKPGQDADMPIYITPETHLKILAEVQLCNTYIHYLTAWDQHYKDRRYNRSDIQTGEQLLKSTAQANKWNDFKMKPSIE